QTASQALQSVALEESVPVINGILVADTMEQALDRAKGRVDRGREFAQAALQMAQIHRKIKVGHG
ncbi:MAG: 6,7-dimethyl-8-ribityllumazine synthase, partial [Opitutae bacterium]|nr:6,7-dimethyl-8-ribityllumazine synthase [Opitutae bacterium]